MRRSVMRLWFGAALMGLGFCGSAATPSRADDGPRSIITEPYDQRPNAITRPAGQADRAWRRNRRSPEIRMTPQARVQTPDYPRYDRGRRVNIPGRPDTYDQFGRAGIPDRRPPIVQSSPTVQTDAATRINQLAPR